MINLYKEHYAAVQKYAFLILKDVGKYYLCIFR